MRLILNADDLGLSREVNERVFDLMARRRITSATLLANAPDFDDAIRQVGHFPWCSFGVHLNLTQFFPLSGHPALQSLLAPDGQFHRRAFRGVQFDAALRRAIFQEWLSQVGKIQAAGIKVSHLDSHHDVHVQPRLFWILKRLQRRCGLSKVRLAETLVVPPQRPSRRNFLWNLAVRIIPPSRTTDGFGQFATFLQASPQHLACYRSLELMVHPGHPRFASETEVLSRSWEEGLPFPITLINYHDL